MKRFKPVHSQYMPSYPLCSTHTFSFPPSNNHISIFSSSGGKKKKKDHISMLKPVKTSHCWGENCCRCIGCRTRRAETGVLCYQVKLLSKISEVKVKDKAGKGIPTSPVSSCSIQSSYWSGGMLCNNSSF